MNCPCENCVCIAVCRQKYFIDLKNQCALIERYLFTGMIYDRRHPKFDERARLVTKAIDPVLWGKKGTTFTWRKRAGEFMLASVRTAGTASASRCANKKI